MPGFGEGLKCPVPGCKTTIHAMTGFQEIEKFRKHYFRVHGCDMTMQEALQRRVIAEDNGNVRNKGG